MKIGVIGTGNIGSGIGKIWVNAGLHVMFGTRDVNSDKIKTLLQSVPKPAKAGRIAEAVAFGEVVLLATPWNVTKEVIKSAGDFSGKVLIDATNPIGPNFSPAIDSGQSAAEQIAELARGARVVKAFNTLGSGLLKDLKFGNITADTFICGDNKEAKAIVTKLATDIGFEVVDTGPLHQSRLLESLALLWINMAFQQGFGTSIAFKLLKK